jgi:ubiquinone/menaquinone biosynthesis C-methylase UbiE
MSDAARFQFTDAAVPRAYEELLVPRIFGPLAKVLLDRVSLRPGEALLDVATGPGTVARLAAERVGPGGRVVGTDISAHMLEVARARSSGIEFRESPAAPLPFPEGEFDVVVCQQGLQFFPDRMAALREMHRVLKPGGRVAVAVWCGIERCKPFADIHSVLCDFLPAETADLVKAPFSWPNWKEHTITVFAAGFRDARGSLHTITYSFEEGTSQAVKVLEASPLAPHVAKLPPAKQAELSAALAGRFAKYLDGGAVRLAMETSVVVGKREGDEASGAIPRSKPRYLGRAAEQGEPVPDPGS